MSFFYKYSSLAMLPGFMPITLLIAVIAAKSPIRAKRSGLVMTKPLCEPAFRAVLSSQGAWLKRSIYWRFG